MMDHQALLHAYQTARRDLLALRDRSGHWIGELSSSALSTATAVSALAIFAREVPDDPRRSACQQLVGRGLGWLAQCPNRDGGWGDTSKSLSNIATTMLVRAAFHLAGAEKNHAGMLDRAAQYIAAQGGTAALRRRYGRDKTFAVPILMNCALAGLTPWREVAPLPFELACLPYRWLRRLRLPVVSYAVPALVAVGQARYFHAKPLNPITRLVRRLSVAKSLAAIEAMQPAGGGYLEAAPLTSFVVMALAATGRATHNVVRRGVQFLLSSFRPDGSCPIDTNLATWNTTLAVNALASATGGVGALGCLDWLLDCQHRQPHPFTQAAVGGWGWSDLPGAVPDADDTAGALLALSVLRSSATEAGCERIDAAAAAGLRWLLDLQNADGGWPTFCRGWGALPFDRSAADLTAHALRALFAWKWLGGGSPWEAEIARALARGLDFLAAQQRADGSWAPLWFGNQHWPGEENPIYGTAKALLAYRDLGMLNHDAAQRGLAWLAANRGPDGGWGGRAQGGAKPAPATPASVEETALAVEALLAAGDDARWQPAVEGGMQWLVAAVESGAHRQSAPVGFYFARLWYYEKVYPLAFAVSALGHAVRTSGAPVAAGSVGV